MTFLLNLVYDGTTPIGNSKYRERPLMPIKTNTSLGDYSNLSEAGMESRLARKQTTELPSCLLRCRKGIYGYLGLTAISGYLVPKLKSLDSRLDQIPESKDSPDMVIG